LLDGGGTINGQWVTNNSRPAFDTADFMRFGTTIIGQLSHVTNQAGVDWVIKNLPKRYKAEMIELNDPNAKHIDATILPLRQGLLVYNPKKVTEQA
jgi:glycine amidinotransferase